MENSTKALEATQPQEIRLDPSHDIDLRGGKFDGTTLAQLEMAFQQFGASTSNHLCIFFHGGLVSRQDGLSTVQALSGAFEATGAYPFFFIWNSDLLTEIVELLHSRAKESDFVEAANRAALEGARRIASVLQDADLSKIVRDQFRRGPMPLDSLEKFTRRFDLAWARQQGAQLPISPQELKQFAQWALALKPSADRRVRFTAARLKASKNPLGRIIERFNSGHDHGLYTTVIEELFIALGISDLVGKQVWGQMKGDIDAAFGSDPFAGGSSFLEQLDAAWIQRPDLRVTLIGHSAGSIYVQRFVEALDERFAAYPERRIEVIFLASAVSFERVHQGLAVLKRRVSGIRLFALSDKREGGYWEVPFVYNKSLLYIVSSLCEADPEADRPLVGMQRYWSHARPYNVPYINDIIQFVQATATVWAPSEKNAPAGFQSNAKRHGDLPTESMTEASVCDALVRGV